MPGVTPGNAVPDVYLPEEVVVVPSQTPFTLELVTQIHSDENYGGEPFRGRVLLPLNTTHGKEVVRAGATVSGHIVGVRQSPLTVYLKFDEVETNWGSQPISASFLSEQPVAGLQVLPPGPQYDAALRRFSGIPLYGDAIGGGPPPEGSEGLTSPIALVPGSRLRLFLTAPIIVHSTTSIPAPFGD